MAIRSIKNNEISEYLERTKRNHHWVGGPEGQLKLRNLRLGIAGLGGMGSNIAEIFARLGVGYLRITDPDVIERANMNRQVIAFENTLGLKKAEASADEIRKISSDIFLEVSTEGINKENAENFVEGLDVVINEIDVYHIQEQVYLIEAALKKGLCVYTSLVVGLGVHFYKFDPKSSYSPREFFGPLLHDLSIENLVGRLGQPLPSYMKEKNLESFIEHVKIAHGVPIFGASTYMGQSLLAVRVLYDQGLLPLRANVPKTPHLPEFLVLDPMTFEFKIAKIKE